MDKGKSQLIVTYRDGWAIKSEGNSKVTEDTRTHLQKICLAVSIVRDQKSDTKFYGGNGNIRSGNSYGNAPKSIKG